MRNFVFLLVSLSTLATSTALAQVVTGDLEGWVHAQESRTPVAFVNVTVQGGNPPVERGAVSGPDGYFRVQGLPVGRYEVTLQNVGYQTTKFDEVLVELGSTTSLGRIGLTATVVEMEEVVVSGRRPLLDFSSADLSDNLNEDVLDRLPTPRDYREAVAYVPQANTSYLGDTTNVAGSTGSENQYFIEGVNVTEPFLASSGMRLPQNFVREIQVKKGGYEAKYGKATGGIINVITHSGTNEFGGQAFAYLTNNNFASDSRRGLGQFEQQDFDRYDIGVSLGGPIVKDELWYFAAYNPTIERENLKIPGLSFYDDRTVSHLFAGKLTWSPDSDTSVDLTVFGDPARQERVGGNVLIETLGTTLNADPLLTDVTKGIVTASLAGRRTLGERAIFEASVSRSEARDKAEPSTEVGRTEATVVDYGSDTLSGGNQNRFDHHTTRWAANAAATVFVGSHELEVGIAYENLRLDELWIVQTPAGRDGLLWGLAPDNWLSTALLNDFEVSHRIPSAYVQDSWRLGDRLRLNAGLRWDGIYIVNAAGETALSINDGYQPRAGFTYQVDENGQNKISGSYGRFYEQLPLIAASWYFGEFYQTLDFYDQNPLPDYSIEPVLSLLFDNSTSAVDDVDGQYLDEFTLGYERRLNDRWRLGLRGIYREVGRVIEDGILPDGTGVFGNPGQGRLDYLPDPVRRYRALELTLANAPGQRLHLSTSYVLSDNYGNYPGAYDTDGDNPHAHVSSSFWDPAQVSSGLLPNDRTHVFKAYGSYDFALGLTTGAFLAWQSGTPLCEYGGTVVGPNAWSHIVPRGTAGRTPSIWDLNLRLAYDLSRLSPFAGTRPRLLLDVFHVFSQRKPVDIEQVHYFGLDEEGNQTSENPNWGKTIAYQPPMTIRLGIETSF